MYDLVIIGGGLSGLSAMIYAQRFNLKTVMFAKELGGLITKTHLVENWPGEASISGFDLAQKLIEHAKGLDAEIRNDEIQEVTKTANGFKVKTANDEIETKTIIFATGTKHRKLDIPGEKEYTNKGVSYCATCDGPFYREKVVGMVGGSDSAVKESFLLAKFAKKVYIIYRRDKLRAEPINMERLKDYENIEVIYNTNVTEVLGDGNTVNKVKLDTGNELELQGLFIAIGHIPLSDLAGGLGVELTERKEIKVNRHMQTNIPGIYAAGDITDGDFKQGITGAGEGARAANQAFEYVNKN